MGFFTLVLIMNDRLISVALIMISSFQMSVTSVPSATKLFSYSNRFRLTGDSGRSILGPVHRSVPS